MGSQHGKKPPNPQHAPKSHGKKPPAPPAHSSRNDGCAFAALMLLGVPVGILALFAYGIAQVVG